LAGMTIGKLVLALVGDKTLKPYKEYIVYGIALTLFFILGPSVVLIVKIMGDVFVPSYVVFVQPVLLIVAITFYSSAVSISNILPKLVTKPYAVNKDVAEKSGV